MIATIEKPFYSKMLVLRYQYQDINESIPSSDEILLFKPKNSSDYQVYW